jgi:hypothetical protein
MRKVIGWLWIAGFFSLLAAVNAQAQPAATAGTAFDGKYRFVSSANVNATYTTRKGQTGQCPSRKAGPLHVVNGRVHYVTATGYRVGGTVGPQGELMMRALAPANQGGSQPIDLSVTGNIDASGRAQVRQNGYECSYDFVWQRQTR